MQLPSGTVTLLFTDIEGSTRMMEQEPEATMRLLSQHDSLLRKVIEQHHGIVFKTLGDGFCVVFTDSLEAIQAAIEIQNQIQAAHWEPLPTFQVRIALHRGEVVLRDGEYLGTALARLARLRDVTYGGQILLTQAVAASVQDHLPEGATLQDLGVITLRGLQRPEHVFQLNCPSLPSHFPGNRFAKSLPNNLPFQLSRFVERAGELEQLTALFLDGDRTVRLLTLVGPGGCGKTRLAQELAARLASHFLDGAWWVDLAPVVSPQLIVPTMLATLGLQETTGTSALAQLQQELQSLHLLLVLDNCEHLVEETTQVVEGLLRTCRNLAVLTTSREALHCAGEKLWQVRPLHVPSLSQTRLADIASCEAVQLWISRAQASDPSFELTEQNASLVAEICRSLDGIPLAIELAAARVGTLSLERINGELHNALRFLSRGKTSTDRHTTMENAIRWSYTLLSLEEQKMLQGLSVFPRDFTLEAAEAIVFEKENDLDVLLNLVEKSLVSFDNAPNRPRYRMLEVIRLFAQVQLAQSDRMSQVQENYLRYYLQFAEMAAKELREGHQSEWLDQLDREYDNLRAALRYAVDANTRLRLAVALYQYWYLRSRFTEGRSWLEGALLRISHSPTKLRADALNCAGILAWAQGDYQAAHQFHLESLEIYKELDDKEGEARALNSLALIAQRQADFALMRHYLEQSLQIFRELNHRATAQVLVNLGGLSTEMGNLAQAHSYFAEAIERLKESGDNITLLMALYNLGEVYFQQKEYSKALRCYRESLLLLQRHFISNLLGRLLDSLAHIAYHAYHQEETAALLLGMAEVCFTTGSEKTSLSPEERHIQNLLQTLQAQMGSDLFRQRYAQGQDTEPKDAIIYGMQQIDSLLQFADNQC